MGLSPLTRNFRSHWQLRAWSTQDPQTLDLGLSSKLELLCPILAKFLRGKGGGGGGSSAALGGIQGVAAWAVGRGQAGANRRARPDGLALGAGSWPCTGECSADGPVELRGCQLVGLRQVWEGAVSFLREVAGPCEQPRGIVGEPVRASPC